MNIIDCKKIRQDMLTEAKLELTKIFALEGKVLKLVVIQIEGDPASDVYIRNKIKTCEECGIECEHIKLPNDVSIGNLKKIIVAASEDSKVNGVMLQLPLPEHLKQYEQILLDTIPWYKDVDGLCTDNVGRLWSGKPCIAPATAQGVMRLLPEDLSEQLVCVVGRSNLVGKPLVKLLMDRDATIEIMHSKTDWNDMHLSIESCDVFISAIGKPKYFKKSNLEDMYGTTIIDVGINRDENGKLCGDIDTESFENCKVNITPVPSGVGILTVSQLILNIIKAYKFQ